MIARTLANAAADVDGILESILDDRLSPPLSRSNRTMLADCRARLRRALADCERAERKRNGSTSPKGA